MATAMCVPNSGLHQQLPLVHKHGWLNVMGPRRVLRLPGR